MTPHAILQYVTILLAIAAAISWLRSARVHLPPTGEEPWEGIGPFHAALVKQSKWNAIAATCAAAAAILQATLLFIED